jgi:hydroxypyruvate isomerase
MQRRTFLSALAGATMTGASMASTSAAGSTTAAGQLADSTRIARKGRLKQSCFSRSFGPNPPPIEVMCREAVRLGAAGMEVFPAEQWPTIRKFGLVPSCGIGGGITTENGIIRKEMHEELAKSLEKFIDECALNGVPDALIVGGQRKGMSYSEGANNAVAFFNRVKDHAEAKGVTLCMEVMNTKYEDPKIGRIDQVCNHLDWAVDVCTRVNSPRVKILFDIYHAQIMDGNIVANIKSAFPLIGHFHTGGVPGRHELDETQELNYKFILKTIADLGYTGYVAHEYDPTPGRDPIQSLEKVFDIADV